MTIIRRKTNNVPFSKNGSISFPLKSPMLATALPWHDLKSMPLAVIVYKKSDNTNEEAMINFNKIRMAKEFM